MFSQKFIKHITSSNQDRIWNNFIINKTIERKFIIDVVKCRPDVPCFGCNPSEYTIIWLSYPTIQICETCYDNYAWLFPNPLYYSMLYTQRIITYIQENPDVESLDLDYLDVKIETKGGPHLWPL